MADMQKMLDYFQLFVCAWIIYGGIVNSGMMFKDDTIHETKKEEFHKIIRIFCFVAGPIGIVGAILNITGHTTLGTISWFLMTAVIVAILILTYRLSDDYVRRKENKNNKK